MAVALSSCNKAPTRTRLEDEISTRVTLADVARRAGVSQTTASFVLAGRGEEMRISAQVEARVLNAAREMKYRPNVVSRSLRTGTTQTIGFVSDTVATTPFAGHLIWGALDAARERDHLLLIAETEGDVDLERQQIEAMLDRRVDGIILASMYTRKLIVPEALLDTDPTLQRSIALRNPYVDPMNFMQVDLLERWRASGRQNRELFEALQASVSGIARGLQTTG